MIEVIWLFGCFPMRGESPAGVVCCCLCCCCCCCGSWFSIPHHDGIGGGCVVVCTLWFSLLLGGMIALSTIIRVTYTIELLLNLHRLQYASEGQTIHRTANISTEGIFGVSPVPQHLIDYGKLLSMLQIKKWRRYYQSCLLWLLAVLMLSWTHP